MHIIHSKFYITKHMLSNLDFLQFSKIYRGFLGRPGAIWQHGRFTIALDRAANRLGWSLVPMYKTIIMVSVNRQWKLIFSASKLSTFKSAYSRLSFRIIFSMLSFKWWTIHFVLHWSLYIFILDCKSDHDGEWR